MKTYILAVLIPCLAFAEGTAKPAATAAAEAGVTNSFLPAGIRLNHAITCLEWYRKQSAPADKLVPIASVRAFLAEAGQALSSRDVARAECEILKNQREACAIARDDAFATATALFANTNALARSRIPAADLLASRKREEGDHAAAKAILESCYAFPDNGVAQLEDIAKSIARSFILRDLCDEAIEAYKQPLRYNSTPDMQKRVNALILDAYKTFYRYEDARAFC